MNRIEERARIEKLIGPLKDANGRERRSFNGRSVSPGRVVAVAEPEPPAHNADTRQNELEYLFLMGRAGARTLHSQIVREIGKFEREHDERLEAIRTNAGLTDRQIERKQNLVRAEAREAMVKRLGPVAICTR